MKEKRVKREHQPGWFTDEIKSLIHDRDKCRNTGKTEQYKILRNKISSMIKRSKKDFFNKAIKDNKNQTFLLKHLKYISNLNQTNTTTLPLKLTKNNI